MKQAIRFPISNLPVSRLPQIEYIINSNKRNIIVSADQLSSDVADGHSDLDNRDVELLVDDCIVLCPKP